MKVGRAILWGAARSDTEVGPRTSCSMTARLVGSDSAENEVSSLLAMVVSIG